MAAAVAVDDARGGVVAHPRRAHQVEAGGREQAVRARVDGAGRVEHLGRAVDRVREHPLRVLVHAVGHARAGDAGVVALRRLELDPVRVVREVLAADRDVQVAAADLLEAAVVPGAPRHVVGEAAERRHERALRARDLQLVAAHEAPRRVALVELVREDGERVRAAVRLEILVEHAGDRRDRVQHEAAPDEAGAVPDAGVEQQPRRADAVRREHDDARGLEPLDAVRVDVVDAGGAAAGIDRDLRDRGVGDDPRAGRDRLRPVGDVGRRLRAGRAAELARAAAVARRAAVVRRRVDVAVAGPPVPAERLERAREPHAAGTERQGGVWRGERGGLAGSPAMPQTPVRRSFRS